jgi:hypothetical protein
LKILFLVYFFLKSIFSGSYKNKKPETQVSGFKVVPPGIEPGTHGFSVHCSTN